MEHQNTPNFSWEPLYRELAHRLLDFHEDRPAFITLAQRVFNRANINLPKLSPNPTDPPTDLDPFTFFSFFNQGRTDANRLALLSAIKYELGLKADLPSAFDGIPKAMNQNALFFPPGSPTAEEDIENLWQLFIFAVKYSDQSDTETKSPLMNYFDHCVDIYRNDYGKITMGLYWLSPETYLNLDGRNEWYIYRSGQLPTELVASLPQVQKKLPAKSYFDILDKIKQFINSDATPLKSLKDLSLAAWQYSEQVNHEQKGQNSTLLDTDLSAPRYWIYSPGRNAEFWNEFYSQSLLAIGWDELGNLSDYATKEQLSDRLDSKVNTTAIWNFIHEMKPGDIVFAKRGRHTLIGRGIVESDYHYDDSRPYYRNVRKITWTDRGEWPYPEQMTAMKTLTEITDKTALVKKLENLFTEEDSEPTTKPDYPSYTRDDFLSSVFLSSENYNLLVDLLQTKKNLILEGAPGVGKTYIAKRLAYSIMGEKDPNRVMMVQFHQSYSYEDFLMGLRPTEAGTFDIHYGAFYDFCQKAAEDSERKYFFIIDEINRGNLSKIFGEAFMLMENDKRGQKVQLLYGEEKFTIPGNLYLIGMMNTADRSLAMIDYALRRRFVFFDLNPDFEDANFKSYQASLASPAFDRLISAIESLNTKISTDPAFGPGFQIGYSYFTGLTPDDVDRRLPLIINYELAPLLREYYIDDPDTAESIIKDLQGKL